MDAKAGALLTELTSGNGSRVWAATGTVVREAGPETLRALARRIGAPADPDAADRPGADSTGTRTTTTDTQE